MGGGGCHTPQQTQYVKSKCIVFEQVYLCLYLYLNIFQDLVFVFVFDLLYLTPSLPTVHKDQLEYHQFPSSGNCLTLIDFNMNLY